MTANSVGVNVGSVSDGTWTINNANEIVYKVPADGATGQFSFYNGQGSGYSYWNFQFIATVVPAAPPSLSQTTASAEVDLVWQPVKNGASYNIWRSTTSGSGYTKIANVSTSANYTDLTVANGTTYYYVVTAVDNIGDSAYSPQVAATPAAPAPGAVTVTVSPGSTQSISPYIYGVNDAESSSVPASRTTFSRHGGNRLTAYNWTTGASNAGSDYQYENDGLLNSSPNVPAGDAKTQITFDLANGLASLVTFQLQGLVASDESGPVSLTNPPDMSRFSTVQFAKGSAFTTSPNTAHPGPVFMDEYAYNIDQLFATQKVFTASAANPVFAQLDNEPDLWSNTHQEIQTSTPITPAAFVTKSIALATALKNQYPQIKIFGAVNWGWSGVQSWQGAIQNTSNTSSNWFIDYYAQALATASQAYGAPLVDLYDFHWYPQVTDTVTGWENIGNLNSSPLTDVQIQEIVQWPRSLYDSTYIENSWIPGTVGGASPNVLPRFNAKLAADNPSMKLAITEYFTGGAGTIAGTIAEADFLGALGANGVFAASLWPLGSGPSIAGGFAAFRNIDGAGTNFGDTSVSASSNNIANVSAWVSTDSAHSGRVVMVLINRSAAPQSTTVNGEPVSGNARIYRMTAANVPSGTTAMAPVLVGTQSVSGSSISLALPAYSVTTVIIN